MIDLLAFLASSAGVFAGLFLFFREDPEAATRDKIRRLGYHVTNYHGELK